MQGGTVSTTVSNERFDQVLCEAHTVSNWLGILQLGHAQQQSSRPVDGEHQGGVAMRAPAPGLVRDEGLVSVEAGEVVDVGVVILGGTPAGLGGEGGVATLLGELAGGRLASIVCGGLDPHSSSVLSSSCCAALSPACVRPAHPAVPHEPSTVHSARLCPCRGHPTIPVSFLGDRPLASYAGAGIRSLFPERHRRVLPEVRSCGRGSRLSASNMAYKILSSRVGIRHATALGGMFWLSRKRFVGS